jgi:hypothetical protein
VWNAFEITNLQEDVAITFSLLKKNFLPTFFDVMMHLFLLVIDELDVCGLVHNQWMYFVEWMMKVLKGYVHSMAQPKRSMVKSYVLEKKLGFVIKYLQEFQHETRRVWDVHERLSKEVLEGIILLKKYLTIL